ncbi:MAG: hypothetical protein IPJ47_05335 [Anaerolineales bacterium]|nr:hypothetical protein [Anaerolineales bacterium]
MDLVVDDRCHDRRGETIFDLRKELPTCVPRGPVNVLPFGRCTSTFGLGGVMWMDIGRQTMDYGR